MIDFYPQIKLVHVAAAFLSGGLFAVRALARFFEQRWAMAAPVRYLSYTIDTVLLTAALMLMTVSHQFPGANPWLTVKVLLIVVYIVLGIFALQRAHTRHARLAYSIAALAVFGTVISIARTHSPLGFIVWLQG